ncbi:hypothetical protein D9C01_13395, partial [Corynebacterium diphtheriae]
VEDDDRLPPGAPAEGAPPGVTASRSDVWEPAMDDAEDLAAVHGERASSTAFTPAPFLVA